MSAVRRILVPTDFSEGSTSALAYARELADATGASLCVVHAVEPCPVNQYNEGCYLPANYLEQVESSARRDLESVLNAEEKRRYDARLVLLNGSAPQVILSYLRAHGDIDLVVMATHGRGGVSRFMMGSVADKIVRTAPCPVLTIRVLDAAESKADRAA